AIEKAIALWEPSSGFLRLCNEIDAKCPNTDELIHRVSVPLIRRAFIDALNNELSILLSRDQPSPTVHILEEGVPIESRNITKNTTTNASIIHTWTKVYRVVEQAIIADELTRSGRI
uniref:DHC_N1 domain-containing protein n=1 Tax=Meloidogyne hapla TaxID=6305 RepID=A0A1I8BPJ2_MELHA